MGSMRTYGFGGLAVRGSGIDRLALMARIASVFRLRPELPLWPLAATEWDGDPNGRIAFPSRTCRYP